MVTVKGPVYKFHLRHLFIYKKLQFSLHQIQISESQTFIHGRQAITARKWASATTFVINDLILKIFHVLIHKRHCAQINRFPPCILDNLSVFVAICNSLDITELALNSGLAMIILHKFLESLFSFSKHHTCKFRESRKHICGIVRHLRSSNPDWKFWENLVNFTNQFLYISKIPNITGKKQNIRLFLI